MFIRLNLDDFLARSGRSADELKRVQGTLPGGAWLAGGAIRRTLIGAALDSDFDYFFSSEGDMEKWANSLPASLRLVRESKHHKHWRGPVEGSDLPIDVQAINFRFYESAESVIDSFDYTITMFALDGAELVTTPEALWDLASRRLAVHRVTYPVATMRRMMKYGEQGFTACAGCMATLFRETARIPDALAELDIAYVD